ncbi:porin [Aquincola sp. S2]|uniref:Porin n=1 Tax=Pseudaquabacterium terrae TaxID=2732868 RepID=A0ABX2ERH3_9BURK|nr:porin [Aquabacterium terrae]NRF71159.1 porin [Aquabacterium terrae]
MPSKLTALKAIVPAVLATSFAGTAFAQSNVTLFGAVDLAVAHGSGSVSNQTQLANGYLAASRLAFKGFEDLGDGLKAGFWLESGFNADTGSGQITNSNNQSSGIGGNGGLTFNRRSHVSLGGNWGEIRLGRDFVPQYLNIADFDPFDLSGSGGSQVLNSAITGPTLVRASNSVSYLYGHGFNAAAIGYGPGGFNGSGIQFHAMVYLGENPSGTATAKDGTGHGIRAVYSTGKFTVSGATSRTRYAAGEVRQSNAGASYNFGGAHVMGMVEWDRKGAISAKGWLAGALVPAGVGTIRVAYSRYGTDAAGSPTARKWSVGYVHPLSKRTALYTAAAHVSNEGASASALNGAVTAPGQSSNGFDFGVKHSF